MNQAWKSFHKNLLFREIIVIIGIIFLWWLIFWKVEWLRFINSLYFTVVTITTIWYGDITPQTDLWKIFAMIYAFMGVPIFISLSWLILESRFNKRMKQYITHFHKELHKAEEELQEVEGKVEKELWYVMRQWKRTQSEVQETEKDIKATNKKISQIQDIIQDEIIQNHPRRKFWRKK